MSMLWFKLFREFANDPKIKRLLPLEQLMFVYLLCLTNDEGQIEYLTEENLAMMIGISPMEDEWSSFSGAFEKFKKFKMITIDNEMITVINFKKRQGESLSGYERLKKYRDKKKLSSLSQQHNDNNDNASDNEYDNNRVEKSRVEKNIKEINKEKISTSSVGADVILPNGKKPKATCPNPLGHPHCIENVESLEVEFGKKVLFPKNLGALHSMYRLGFTDGDIQHAITTIETNQFYRANGWDLADILKLLSKGGTRYGLQNQ